MNAAPAIAIASGKGGTGKTTVAVHLAAALATRGRAVQYLDCDVEEPNGHLFLKPAIEASESVGIPVPVVASDGRSVLSATVLAVIPRSPFPQR